MNEYQGEFLYIKQIIERFMLNVGINRNIESEIGVSPSLSSFQPEVPLFNIWDPRGTDQ